MMSLALLTHPNPDGDAIGANLGCAALSELHATPYLHGDLPRWFLAIHDLLGAPAYRTEIATESQCWLLDAPHLGRLGPWRPDPAPRILLHVDHHPRDASVVADESQRDETASSACEILASLARARSWPVTPTVASWWFLGLMTDTLNFTASATTARTHDLAAWLIAQGAQHTDIARIERRSLTRQHLAFQTAVLAAAQWHGDTLVLLVPASVRRNYGVGANDAKMIFDVSGRLCDGDVVIMLVEEDDGRVFLSARSREAGPAQAVARALGGDGHPNAAGAQMATDFDAALTRVWQVLESAAR